MLVGTKNKKAFTLTELIIVIAVLAILTAIAVPSVSAVIDNSKKSADNINADYIEDAIKYAIELNKISAYSQIKTVGKALEISGMDPDEGLVSQCKGYNFYYENASGDVTAQNSHPGAGFALLHKDSPILYTDGVWGIIEYVPVQSASINPGTLSLKVGDVQPLTASIYPSNSTNKELIWESDNLSIATVDSNGEVRAVSPGIANIKATVNGTGISSTCVVLVFIPAESISISESLDLARGSSFNLAPSITPSGATNYDISWSVDNPNIALIAKNEDNSCTITGVSAGEALITVTLTNADGSKITDTCSVSVKIPATGISIPESIELSVGETETLSAVITPSGATGYTLSWSSNKTNIATVSGGTVTAVAPGSAVITVTLTNFDGSKLTDTCTVTVKSIPVTKIELNYTRLNFKKDGNTYYNGFAFQRN